MTNKIEDIENTYHIKALKEVKMPKKILNAWNNLEPYQQEEGTLEMLADKVKYIGDKSVASWLNELKKMGK